MTLRDKARILRAKKTDAERHLEQQLRRKQINGYRFRRQVPLGRDIVDFACFEARMVVEVDGGQYTEDAAQDRRRDERLAAQGFRVLRFWNNDVLFETETVVEVILRTLMQPPPHPSPVTGEGELEYGDEKSFRPGPSTIKGEMPHRMHEIPPPWSGGGEGEG